MNDLLREFVADTNARFGDRLRSPQELFNQQLAADQCLDATVIGGYGVRDIIAGKVHESQISPLVIKAFHSHYPHAGDFVDFVRDHKGDASLLGFINGIKGKAFELEYLDYLNHGHLPAGAVAELATSPTQEGWDIAIRDSTGHVIEHLQLKATESMSYIADAIATTRRLTWWRHTRSSSTWTTPRFCHTSLTPAFPTRTWKMWPPIQSTT